MAEPEVDQTLLMKLAQRPSTLKVSLQSTKERFSCKHYLKSFKYNPYLTRHMRINHNYLEAKDRISCQIRIQYCPLLEKVTI